MRLVIYYTNGSDDWKYVKTVAEGYEAANKVSVSSGKVSRIILITGDSERALWDKNWDALSNAAGLRMPR
jgi:hypothetical protein